MNLSGVAFVIVNSHEGVRSALAAFLREKGAIVFVSPDAFEAWVGCQRASITNGRAESA